LRVLAILTFRHDDDVRHYQHPTVKRVLTAGVRPMGIYRGLAQECGESVTYKHCRTVKRVMRVLSGYPLYMSLSGINNSGINTQHAPNYNINPHSFSVSLRLWAASPHRSDSKDGRQSCSPTVKRE